MEVIKKIRANWQLAAAAVLGTVVIGIGAYYVLRTPEATTLDDEEYEDKQPSGTTDESNAASGSAAKNTEDDSQVVEISTASAVSARSESITRQQLKDILKHMFESLTALKDEIEGERFRMEAAGLSPEEVEAAMGERMQEGMAETEQDIQRTAGVTQEAIMKAQQEFAGDPEIDPLTTQLRNLFFGEEQLAEIQAAAATVPADMTAATFVTMLKKHVAVMDARVGSLFKQAKSDTRGSNVSGPERMQYAEMLIVRQLDGIMEEALEAGGMSQDMFRGCLLKFGNEPAVMAVMMDSHRRQEELKEGLLRA